MEEKNKPVVKREDYVSSLDGQTHYYSEITLPEIIYEGYRTIKFKKPLVIKCHSINSTDNGHKTAFYRFDFGMEGQTPLDKEHNFILMHSDNLSNEEKIAFDVEFDLFHAFFHTAEDPNYTYYHWALYGNLKDRVETEEDCDAMEKDLKEQNEFYKSRKWIKGICDCCGGKDIEVFSVEGKPLIEGIACCRDCNEKFEKGDYAVIFEKIKQKKENKNGAMVKVEICDSSKVSVGGSSPPSPANLKI